MERGAAGTPAAVGGRIDAGELVGERRSGRSAWSAGGSHPTAVQRATSPAPPDPQQASGKVDVDRERAPGHLHLPAPNVSTHAVSQIRQRSPLSHPRPAATTWRRRSSSQTPVLLAIARRDLRRPEPGEAPRVPPSARRPGCRAVALQLQPRPTRGERNLRKPRPLWHHQRQRTAWMRPAWCGWLRLGRSTLAVSERCQSSAHASSPGAGSSGARSRMSCSTVRPRAGRGLGAVQSGPAHLQVRSTARAPARAVSAAGDQRFARRSHRSPKIAANERA